MNAKLREIMIQGVRNSVEMSLRAIWRTRREVESPLGRLFESLTCVVEEDIFQGDLLQVHAVDLNALVGEGRNDHCGAFLSEFANHLPHEKTARNVKEGCWLVKHRNLWTLSQNFTVLDLLSHSSTHEPCPFLPSVPQVDGSQDLFDSLRSLLFAKPGSHFEMPI